MPKIKAYINKGSLRRFYMGNLYPAIVCLLTAAGSISTLEMYFGIIHVAMIFTTFLLCDSIKPIVISLLTFVMQLSVKNSPFYPNYSNYYYTGWRLPCLVIMIFAVIAGIIIFIVKNKIYRRVSQKSSPLLIPLLVLSLSFLINGMFSGKWVTADLIFGFVNAAVWLLVYLLLYHGFAENESTEECAGYFSYISALISILISSELTALFISSDNILINGSINKVGVALGWGIWNLIGVSLSILIPVIFYGVHKNKYPWLYFASATLAYAAAVLTMSRNALIFSSLAYMSCIFISCFIGKQKRTFRIITMLGALALVILGIFFFDKIYTLLGDYFKRGLSDNGRYALWRAAFANFLRSPIFGAGFYGFSPEGLDSFGPFLKQAHNTVLQLLSATGIFGLAAYLYYRYNTACEVLKHPTFLKTMMALSMSVLILESLFDNFLFNIYPMFYYNVALAVICRANRAKKES